MFKAEVKFTDDPIKKANKLRAGLRNKIIRIAMQKASAPVKEAVIASAPSDVGLLKKSIKIRVKGYKDSLKWVSVIGPSTSFKRSGKKRSKGKHKGEKTVIFPSRYAGLVVKGTYKNAPQDFLSEAMSQTRELFYTILREKIESQISEYLSAKTK